MRSFVFAIILSIVAAPVAAQPIIKDMDAAQTLGTVLVTGEQPGPGMWKVSRGEHVLWILGTQSPLPKKMNWRAAQVEKTIAQSQEVLADANAKLDINFFRALTLVPSILGARKNADGDKLEDILPRPLYARWLLLKAKYIGHDRGIERMRPMVAAAELYKDAIEHSGLTGRNDVWKVIEAAARKNHVPITTPLVKIPIDDPKQALKDFKSTAGDLDVACLAKTIERLETDLSSMRQRANAWAIGDLDGLKHLPYPDQRAACLAAVSSNQNLREHILAAQASIDGEWINAADTALSANASTFAVVPIYELLRPNGRLDALRDKGYVVETPE